MDNLTPEQRKERLKFAHFFVEPEDIGTDQDRGSATVAILRDDDGMFHYAVAICSPLDNFSRPIGRAISSGRLLCEKGHARARLFVRGDVEQPANEAVAAELALNEFLDQPLNCPQWLVDREVSFRGRRRNGSPDPEAAAGALAVEEEAA